MLRLVRDGEKDGATFGRLYIGSEFVAYTLENTDKLIPTGVYCIKNTYSPKFNRVLPLVYNTKVAASRGIRIHRGNSKKDSSGCILVGLKAKSNTYILNSAYAETMVVGLCFHQDDIVIS